MMMREGHENRADLYTPISKEAMESQLRDESVEYAGAQKPERNEGVLHSGVNRLVRGSQNIYQSGSLKDPLKIS